MHYYTTEIDPIFRIGTLAEACELWKLDRKTITWAYWRGEVTMRKSAGTWIVDFADMVVRFGEPKGRMRDDNTPKPDKLQLLEFNQQREKP